VDKYMPIDSHACLLIGYLLLSVCVLLLCVFNFRHSSVTLLLHVYTLCMI